MSTAIAAHRLGFISRNVKIAYDMAMRDLRSKYARSGMGLVWFILTPLLMTAVYWSVFGGILGLSWNHPMTGAPVGFIVPFFAGLLVYLYFADLIISSLGLFASKRNYVLKSPFPLWVLWLANLIRASAHAAANLLILTALTIGSGLLTPSGLLWMIPALLLVFAFAATLSLLLAMIGAFIDDLAEAARVAMRVVFYAAPITYPLAIVPERFQWISWSNPLTHLIEPLRNAAAFGIGPEAKPALAFVLATLLLAAATRWTYRRLKGAVSDVV